MQSPTTLLDLPLRPVIVPYRHTLLRMLTVSRTLRRHHPNKPCPPLFMRQMLNIEAAFSVFHSLDIGLVDRLPVLIDQTFW